MLAGITPDCFEETSHSLGQAAKNDVYMISRLRHKIEVFIPGAKVVIKYVLLIRFLGRFLLEQDRSDKSYRITNSSEVVIT